jgi:hypothetical protein
MKSIDPDNLRPVVNRGAEIIGHEYQARYRIWIADMVVGWMLFAFFAILTLLDLKGQWDRNTFSALQLAEDVGFLILTGCLIVRYQKRRP